ncbi:MAG: hypothetical protein IKV68_01450 [Oscillospiraceae bacterium]|nr:hypothetical protein [Oscillospiraceae bacterium]
MIKLPLTGTGYVLQGKKKRRAEICAPLLCCLSQKKTPAKEKKAGKGIDIKHYSREKNHCKEQKLRKYYLKKIASL